MRGFLRFFRLFTIQQYFYAYYFEKKKTFILRNPQKRTENGLTIFWKEMKMKSQVMSLIVLVILSVSATVCNGVEYQLIDLSLLSGKPGCAKAINSNGQIVGYWGQPGTVGSSSCHAFLYDDGTITDLSPSNYGSAAYSINNNGQVVGWMEVFGGHRRGFLYENNVMSELYGQSYELRGHWTEASAINNTAQIVGFSDFGKSYGYLYGFLYEDGIATDLGRCGSICGINNSGQIVGYLNDGSYDRAFLYADGVKKDLGILGGRESRAFGINDNGQVVGWSDTDFTTAGSEHAFLYDNGVMIDLVGTLLNGERSHATAINNLGQIVGYSYASDGQHAFLYDNGVMTDLGFGAAYGINDNGWIVGESVGHAVLWVPEPATLLLLGFGALMLRRRRN
jgi:probable HAF family extracellular repeat protein